MYVYKPTSKSLKCVHKPSVSSWASHASSTPPPHSWIEP